MSDIAPAADPAAEAASVEAESAEQVDPFDQGAEQFPRPYVERLRQDNQQLRDRYRPYEQTFSQFHPDDREALLHLANVMRSGDVGQAAQLMRQYADILSPAQQQQVMQQTQQVAQQQQDQQGQPQPQYMTKQEFEQAITEREQATQLENQVKDIYSEAERLGYPPGHPDHVKLLLMARDGHDGNLEAAAQALAAERERVIQEYLAAKTGQPNPRPAPRTGSTPSDNKGAPTNLKDAKAAMDERLRNVKGQFV